MTETDLAQEPGDNVQAHRRDHVEQREVGDMDQIIASHRHGQCQGKGQETRGDQDAPVFTNAVPHG